MMRECIILHAHTSNTATVKQSRFKVLFVMGYVIHAGLWSSGEYWVSISLWWNARNFSRQQKVKVMEETYSELTKTDHMPEQIQTS